MRWLVRRRELPASDSTMLWGMGFAWCGSAGIPEGDTPCTLVAGCDHHPKQWTDLQHQPSTCISTRVARASRRSTSAETCSTSGRRRDLSASSTTPACAGMKLGRSRIGSSPARQWRRWRLEGNDVRGARLWERVSVRTDGMAPCDLGRH